MEVIMTRITKELIFWMAWIIIPLLWEIVPAFGGAFILLKKMYVSKKYNKPIKYPEITVIVPVYNSAETLRNCLKSIYDSEYPTSMMEIYLVDNGSKDESYDIFVKCQAEFDDMAIDRKSVV